MMFLSLASGRSGGDSLAGCAILRAPGDSPGRRGRQRGAEEAPLLRLQGRLSEGGEGLPTYLLTA